MKQRIGLWLAAIAALIVSVPVVPVAAQDFRGAVSGTISDASGGVLPGVTITVTNVETNVATTTVTDDRGAYSVRYLNAGTYNVQAELEGLQTVLQRGVSIRVGDNVPINFTMQPGGVSEVIEVTAEQPIIDSTTGVTGQVIDSKQIEQMPLGDGTAMMLTRLAPGVVDASDLHFSRPMDNGNLAGIVANGARGGNDFTLDGAPNRVSPNNTTPENNSGVVGFSPPSDAISQFKVQTNAFDAQAGHTAGATVNLALKSGTNAWNGSMSYFNRDDSRSATPLLSERAGAEKPTREYNRYTGTFSGPVIRDRTFFMIAFERLRDVQPESASYTVPTMKMRQGDLSEWLPSVQVFDPLTATGNNNQRTAFAGNVIPADRINAIARAYALLYPEPNRPGLEDNYFTNQLRPYDYNAFLLRGDHNFNGSNRLFFNGYWNKREEDRYNWAKGAANATGEGEINGFLVTQGFDYRSNSGLTLGHTAMVSDRLMFDVIGGWSQFGEWRAPADEFNPAELGFSSAVTQLMNGYNYLPFITFGGFSTTNSNSRIATLGSQRADFGTGFDRPFTNISVTPTVSWISNAHSIRAGYELRHQRWQIDNAEYGAGRYHFNGAYTRANNAGATNVLAQSWAQFLLGLPTTGTNAVATPGSTASQFEIAADADYRQVSHSLFVQDDWTINPKLTINGGVRLEYHNAMEEADNRALAGFNPALDSPIGAAAMAKYAANPIAEIPANQFAVRGGLEFADGPIYNNMFKFLPRVAASYLLNNRTVIRGGIGLFSYDYYFDAGNQTGFSQPTAIVTTENSRTFLTDLSNPIPGGSLVQPPGSSLGASTGLGLNIGTVVPSEREIPYYTRWQIGVQRDLGAGWAAEVYYVDSRGRNLPVLREINGIPAQFLSTATQRDAAHETFLSTNVPNPFQGLLPGTGFNGATIARSQLLRTFPQYQSIVTEEYNGEDTYRAGSVRIEKRFRSGNSLIATYTRSELRDQVNLLNPSDGELEDRVSPNDRPHRATLGATLALPFGRDRRYGQNWGSFMNAVLGGWTLSTTYQYQSGFPLLWANNIYYDPTRDPNELKSNIGGDCPNGGTAGLDCPAWDTSGFYIAGGTGRTDQRIVMGNTLRRFPSTLDGIRTDDLHLMDVGIYKTFGITSGVNLQVRVEVINALNYTVLWNPNQDPTNANFGFVNQDRNNPRDVQLGAKLTF
jgi:Carboxypeptidase regulatory-like domain